MDRKIFFGGVEMPAPKVNGGLVETYEDVWSANTGRNSAGSMVGTLVATKAKLKFSWNALSWEEAPSTARGSPPAPTQGWTDRPTR